MRFESTDVFESSPNYPKFTPQTLKFLGAIEFGSRALGVDNEYSDYDFAILRSIYEKLVENCDKFPELPIKNYFKVIPPYGNNTLVKIIIDNKQYDLLIIEHQEHIDIIKKSIQYLYGIKSNLIDKNYRIFMFENVLLSNGFVLDWRYKIIRWFAKLTHLKTKTWLPNTSPK